MRQIEGIHSLLKERDILFFSCISGTAADEYLGNRQPATGHSASIRTGSCMENRRQNISGLYPNGNLFGLHVFKVNNVVH